jgi:hypothetical protein
MSVSTRFFIRVDDEDFGSTLLAIRLCDLILVLEPTSCTTAWLHRPPNTPDISVNCWIPRLRQAFSTFEEKR